MLERLVAAGTEVVPRPEPVADRIAAVRDVEQRLASLGRVPDPRDPIFCSEPGLLIALSPVPLSYAGLPLVAAHGRAVITYTLPMQSALSWEPKFENRNSHA